MSIVNKKRKQIDIAMAILRSNWMCIYCGEKFNVNTFEFEHIHCNENDAETGIACMICNRSKATKSLFDFCRGNVEKVKRIESILDLVFENDDINRCLRFLSDAIISDAIAKNRDLLISEMRFICTPKARQNSLPNGLKLSATKRELDLFANYYRFDNLDVYLMRE